jgi:hypothetical protein
MLKGIKKWYNNNECTVKVILVCLIVLFMLMLLYKVYDCSSKKDKNEELFKVDENIDEKVDDIAVDAKYCYILTKNGSLIKKFNKKKDTLVLENKLPFKSKKIFCINGDVVCLDSQNNTLVWCDNLTLNVADAIEIPVKDKTEWMCNDGNKWWIYGNNNLLCFDVDWKQLGYWRFPKNIKINSGFVIDEYLYGIDKTKQMYIFYLVPDKVKLKVVNKIKVNFNGNFTIDILKNKIWAINDKKIIKLTVNL